MTIFKKHELRGIMTIGNSLRREVSLAILPFQNLTGDSHFDFICSGLAIELVTELTRFRQFKIVSAEAVLQNADSEFLMKGSVSKPHAVLRVTVQLVKASNGVVIWADRYEAEPDSFFDVMESMVKEIVSTFQIQVNHHLLMNVRGRDRSELSAYELWILGMDELKKGTLQADEIARSHFEESLKIDPTFSLGYSGISLTYFNEWSCQLWERWDVSRKGAFSWAKKAMDLDPGNYVASFILGRIYLYEGHYDLAEEYLRRALALNSNDSEILAQISVAFVYLGLPQEAGALFTKANEINRLNASQFKSIGALIALENGDYQKCISLGSSCDSPWVDFNAMVAAAYHYCGDHEQRDEFWRRFMMEFRLKISKDDREAQTLEGLQWIINVSPYKNDTNLRPFWEYIAGRKVSVRERSFQRTASPAIRNEFIREGDYWTISFQQTCFTIPEVKGFRDLAQLLANPEKEFHCMTLMGGVVSQSGEPVFDEKAELSYRKRILELKQEIELSEVNNDYGKSLVLHQEYDQLINHLSSALGIKGGIRKTNDTVEKARSAVTWRIRHAIQRINKHDTSLGKHLSVSVQTGVFCKYSPEKIIEWVV